MKDLPEDLPEIFYMTDYNDFYSHEGVYYKCEGKSFKIYNKDVLISEVEYNENYDVVNGKLNGKPVNLYYNLIHYWNDPRYILSHGEFVNLNCYGLNGYGYIVHKTDNGIFCPIHHIVVFESIKRFIVYTFIDKLPWEEFRKQRWIFDIKEQI